MNIKKAVKKIVAISTAATMMGATILGATAQSDLGSYPEMFVTNGVYNGYIVIGDSATALDNIAQTVVASNMWVAGTGGSASSTVSVAGDAWKVGTTSDMLEIGEAIGPTTGGVVDFIDSEDLDSLADGKLSNSQGTFDYEQFLHFDDSRSGVVFEEEDNTGNDVTGLFFKVPNGAQIARYELDFLEAAESDIDVSDRSSLDDLESKEIVMLGTSFNIVKAIYDGSEGVELTLMGGSTRDTLNVGESREYTLNGQPVLVELTFTNTNDEARFKVKGETTPLMDEGETYTLSDGTELGISEVLHQDYAGGIQQVEFFMGANKVVLKDTNITDTLYGNSLEVAEDTIEDAKVRITGTMLTLPVGTTTDGELEIDNIEVNMTADDDFWVGDGEKLGDNPDLDEPQVLFTQNWNIEFRGLDDKGGRTTISLDSQNSDEEYHMTFSNERGDEMDFPLAYGGVLNNVRLGDKDDVLVLDPKKTGGIADEQYFILNDDTDEDSITHVIQYKGSDKSTDDDPKVRFDVLAKNEQRERSYSAANDQVTLKLDGTTYTFTNASDDTLSDFNISLVTGGVDTFAPSADGGSNFLITDNGGKILITDENLSSNTGMIRFNISEIDNDAMDELTAPQEIYNGFINNLTDEVDLVSTGGVTLTSPDNNDDHNLGYSTYGAFVDVFDGGSSNTDADTFDITIPEQQSEALVYVTTSGTSFASVTNAEGLVSVNVPPVAVKLASEVSSLSAQNVILIGGPCANSATNAIEQPGTDCAAGYNPGEARIKLYPNGNNWAMVVAGYSGDDTRRAGEVLANPATYTLSGTEVKVTGTSSSDISVTSVQ